MNPKMRRLSVYSETYFLGFEAACFELDDAICDVDDDVICGYLVAK